MRAKLAIAIAVLACAAHGQKIFDAASVRAVESGAGPFHFTILPNRLDVKNMSLKFLIKRAYNVRDDQISGPDWLANHRYDIVATAGMQVPQATMLVMLQSLLIERFKLATHWDTKTKAIYRLTVLPKGSKMKPAETGYTLPNSPMLDKGALQFHTPMTMQQLAEVLTRYAGRPVVDETNLEGFFTVDLTFASDDVESAVPDGGFAPPRLPVAIQDQLGLKLVSDSGPVKILVIDHVEQVPTAN